MRPEIRAGQHVYTNQPKEIAAKAGLSQDVFSVDTGKSRFREWYERNEKKLWIVGFGLIASAIVYAHYVDAAYPVAR